MIRNFLLLASALFVLAGTSTATAQDARAHFLRGQAAYDTGDYTTAVSEWRTAYGLDARPLLQYNLAQAYERLGQLQEAVTAYETYVNSSDTDPDRMSSARARVAALRERLNQTSIRLTGGPEGATIVVDGQDRGRLPHPDPLRVQPGSHRIVIRAQGFQDFVSTVAVSAGQAVDVPVEMVRGVSGQASNTAGGGISMVGVAVAAGGGAILIGGAVTGGLALSWAGSAQTPDDANANDARTLALVTDILLPVGAAAAIAGVVLMFVLPPDGGGNSTARVVPVVGPDYAGVSASGAF